MWPKRSKCWLWSHKQVTSTLQPVCYSCCPPARQPLHAICYKHAKGNNVSQRLHSCPPSVFRGLHPVFLSFLRKHSACSQHLLINNGLLYCSIQTRFHAISEKAEGNVTDREKLELLWLKRQLRERKKLRGSHCRTLTFRNRVSLKLLVSGPEPLQFQSKWQCFSESSSSNVSTTKNWIYKSSDILVKKKKCQGPTGGLWSLYCRPSSVWANSPVFHGPELGLVLLFWVSPPTLRLGAPLTPRLAVEWHRLPPILAVPANKQTGSSNPVFF